ncbi:RNA polymerase II C-terminal domain phosphatase-like 1 [Brassica rapa]|uniref:RNA polymerase II C-terminal domain phosphatase-like 1 n=1 Tax=Brassica campestris TaxID=3711 RepID=UPI00142DB285|nr:RNA polymerase II C-terminal domain phosphatase-like 1 [Brassica rapa]XP_018515453.2 RNA polymerase II C-terminal domain phosphatase-like 1 [Brassica rapa]
MYNSNRVQVYHEDVRVGEMEIHPLKEDDVLKERKKRVMEEVKMGIKISGFSQPSKRCTPLSVLTTISSSGLCFKLEATTAAHDPLSVFHSSCLRDQKTAVMSLGGEELHLVAMCSEDINNDRPCFWAFTVAPGMYDSCLGMLNLRCLGIVFDLDETLVVANTLHTFEVKMEGLLRRMSSEVDPRRRAVMVAQMKRYQDDKNLLKQYVESDQVVENGEVIKAQSEIVPALSDNHQPLVRSLIRLQEKNIVLTRINPMKRDTSVLVRLRTSWEELRSYLTAKEQRKRFEVYVCTMADKDYALEMWRLLDPEGNLINANDLLARIVCVKSGFKKSLFNVFLNATCHPKMALVIDDRREVWDEKDQPRVHVVRAFAPYHSPKAEAAATPVLCAAKNLACVVRTGFFKHFDDSLLPRIAEISYENDVEDIPSPPDVSHYLVSEDVTSGLNGNKDPLSSDKMADAGVGRILKEAICGSSAALPAANTDPRIAAPVQQPIASASYVSAPVPVPVPVPAPVPVPVMQQAPQPIASASYVSAPVPVPVPAPVPVPVMQQAPQPSAIALPSIQFQQPAIVATHLVPSETSLQNSPASEGEVPESELDLDTRRRLLILKHGQDPRDAAPSEPSFPKRPPVQAPPPRVQPRNGWFAAEEEMDPKTENPVGLLHEIAIKCGTKVDYKPGLVASTNMRFSIEAWFCGKKIGVGIGKSRREALQKAAEFSIQNLADIYLSRENGDAGPSHRDAGPLTNQPSAGDETAMPVATYTRLEGSIRHNGSIPTLRELCASEGWELSFQSQRPLHSDMVHTEEFHAKVAINGRVLGEGVGSTWEKARMNAAERALGNVGPLLQRQVSSRSFGGKSNKRLKPNFQRSMQRMASSGRSS